MDAIWSAITDWLKEILISGILGNLSGMFDGVNGQVGNIAAQVGTTPQAWNGGIFDMVQNLSNTVVLPIAGVVLTFVMTLELIQMVTDRNSMHDIDTWMFFKWIFKTACAVLIVSNTWNIVMGVFDVAQSVVNSAAGVIVSDASIDISSAVTDLEVQLEAMELGPLLGLWLQSMFVGLTMWALSICIFIVIYGRMIEIYLVTSVAPIPMAAMLGKEFGGMGQNYLRSLFALGFQAFLIMVCVGIYAVLVRNIAFSGDVVASIWSCVGYTVLLCFTLFKSGSLAKGVFSAHYNTYGGISMSETKARETANVPPLNVEAKVYPSKKEGNLLAYASVTLGGCFAINNIRIMDSQKGMFLAMPDRQDAKGEYRDVCFPTTAEMRQALTGAVMGEYQRVMELLSERGAKAKTSVRDALQAAPQKTAKEAKQPDKQKKATRGDR